MSKKLWSSLTEMFISKKASALKGSGPTVTPARKEPLIGKTPGRHQESHISACSVRSEPVKIQTIISENDLPKCSWTVMSASGGGVKISDANRANIVVLELDKSGAECCIIVKRDSYGDTVYLDVKHQLTILKCKISFTSFADSGFINKIYEGSKKNDSNNDEEGTRALFDIIDNDLFAKALEKGASDIHIEIRETDTQILMRIDGVMTKVGVWSTKKAKQVANQLFVMADDKTKSISSSEDVGQSMSIKRVIKATTLKLRLQSESAYPEGKDIVMRVIPEGAKAKVRSMEELGYSPGHQLMLIAMLSRPKGAIIIAGTTGSGKSTSLQTLMYDIRKSDTGLKMYSIEDPPELIMPGITQIPVRTGAKDAYGNTMRNAMRMDPDVLMVGELRDEESAELFTRMVQSGHKALTTLHASSGFGIFGRLLRMNVDEGVLSDNDYISGLIYQTLVPVLCKHCKQEYIPEEWDDFNASDAEGDDKKILGFPGIHNRIQDIRKQGDSIFVRGKGCSKCNQGIAGRTVCAEIILPTPWMRELVRKGDVNGAFQRWKSLKRPGRETERTLAAMTGMTALDHAIYKLRVGLVSPADVETALGFLTGYEDDEIDLELE